MIPLKVNTPKEGTPFILWILVAINGIVFLFEDSLAPAALGRFIRLYAVVPARYHLFHWTSFSELPAHRYWALVTYMFIHGGWLHIIGNMWFLWIFGASVEDRMGHLRFLVFYLLCGIGAVIAYMTLAPGSPIPTLGASGAISGVMGAYILLYPRARVLTLIPVFFLPLFVQIPAIFFVGIWFIFQVLAGTMSFLTPRIEGGVAWWAHVGGLVIGMLLLPLFRERSRASSGSAPLDGHAFHRMS
jgi:membrane associated rhomboid family serine protease